MAVIGLKRRDDLGWPWPEYPAPCRHRSSVAPAPAPCRHRRRSGWSNCVPASGRSTSASDDIVAQRRAHLRPGQHSRLERLTAVLTSRGLGRRQDALSRTGVARAGRRRAARRACQRAPSAWMSVTLSSGGAVDSAASSSRSAPWRVLATARRTGWWKPGAGRNRPWPARGALWATCCHGTLARATRVGLAEIWAKV